MSRYQSRSWSFFIFERNWKLIIFRKWIRKFTTIWIVFAFCICFWGRQQHVFMMRTKQQWKSWENPSLPIEFFAFLSRKSHEHFHKSFLIESFEETLFFWVFSYCIDSHVTPSFHHQFLFLSLLQNPKTPTQLKKLSSAKLMKYRNDLSSLYFAPSMSHLL